MSGKVNATKFLIIIRIPKKYADNYEKRVYRCLQVSFAPENLFDFLQKSNKFLWV